MPRPLPRPLTLPTGMLALVMASSLALPFTVGFAQGLEISPGSARRAQPSAAISEARARAAAER
ncbi:MAG TPA: DUF3887 domain-containing protein, partial [Cyanobium sp.]|nr:DUF3887 domain-containing protein [Cyanobium sp.]